MKLLWICLICAWPLLGEQTLLIDMSGDWRQSSDDKPAYAQADFDDHNWAVVQLPWTSSPVGGVFWLRKSIELPDWANRSKIVLSLGPVREVYDLYVNGQKIATTGPFFDDNMAQIARPRSFAIPTEAMAGGRLIAVSIRTRWPQNVSIGESFRVFKGGHTELLTPKMWLRKTGSMLLTAEERFMRRSLFSRHCCSRSLAYSRSSGWPREIEANYSGLGW